LNLERRRSLFERIVVLRFESWFSLTSGPEDVHIWMRCRIGCRDADARTFSIGQSLLPLPSGEKRTNVSGRRQLSFGPRTVEWRPYNADARSLFVVCIRKSLLPKIKPHDLLAYDIPNVWHQGMTKPARF